MIDVEETDSPPAPQPEVYPRRDHPISRRNIDPDALKILYRLSRAGFKAYLVGGGVRDLLLHKKPKDFDIATDATPREIKGLFRNSRVIGRRYKLVHIFFSGGKNIEVSTFRDIQVPVDPNTITDSNEPIVTRENTYGTEATDAVRRDLTINALFYDASTFSIIDYVGGVRDLQNKIIRVIGEPDVRFAEDPVRMLRVARHAARNDFVIDEHSRESTLKNFHLIARASPVRVYDELKKDLTYGYSLKTFRLFAELNLLEPLIPELTQKGAVLLSDVSEFSRCLSRLDTLARAGTALSTCSALALMMLFMQGLNSTRKDIYSWFRDRHEIVSASKSYFRYLSVPKKERERIAAVLSLWHDLGPPPFSREQLSILRRHPGREDLPLLIQYLADDEDVDTLLKLIAAIPDERSSRYSSRGRGSQSRGPNRSHPRPGRFNRPP